MPRSVPPWIGKTPDTPVPQKVRVRVFEAKGGRCHMCGRKIQTGEAWTCEHVIALINGGLNAEPNLDLTCGWCLPQKNATDVAIKSKSYRVRSKHLGLKKPKGRPIIGSKASGWRRKMDGTLVKRH